MVWALLSVALLALPAKAAPYERYFRQYTEQYWSDVPYIQWPFLESVAWAESSFRADAISPAGAKGLLQILSSTFADIQRAVPSIRGHSPFDPKTSIMAGSYYMRFGCWNFWILPRSPDEQARFTLASYNAGPGNIDRAWTLATQRGWGGDWRAVARALPEVTGQANAHETTRYVDKIMPRYMRRLAEEQPSPLAVPVNLPAMDLKEAVEDVSPPIATAVNQVSIEREKEQVETAIANLGVASLGELLMHNGGYKISLLIVSLLIGVYVPIWAFKMWDKMLKYDTAKQIQDGSRLVAGITAIQMIGIFTVICLSLYLLH